MTAAELYPRAVAAAIELVRAQRARAARHPDDVDDDGDPADAFVEALRAWQQDRDVSAHLAMYAGMGSLADGELAYWDAERRSYESDIWPAAAFDALRNAILTSGTQIVAGRGDEDVPKRHEFSFGAQAHERCATCGYEYVDRRTLERLAALLWREFGVERLLRSRDEHTLVAEALAAPDAPSCRSYLDAVSAELERHGIDITESFREIGFDDVSDEGPFDEPVQATSADDPCPRCGANAWRLHYWHVTAPPVRLEERSDPLSVPEERRRSG